MTVPELKTGDVIIFDAVPNGSYLSNGVAYRIENIGKRDVYFRRTDRTSGTSESRYMLACAGVVFHRV